MRLDVTDEEASLVLQALGELPAKVSFNLINKLASQVSAEQNRRRQSLDPSAPTGEGNNGGTG